MRTNENIQKTSIVTPSVQKKKRVITKPVARKGLSWHAAIIMTSGDVDRAEQANQFHYFARKIEFDSDDIYATAGYF